MKKINFFIANLVIMLSLVCVTGIISKTVGATADRHSDAALLANNISSEITKGINQTGVNSSGSSIDGLFKSVVNILLYLIGAVAVIMIVYAGFMYVTSGGSPDKIAKAKATITYSVIGIVVAILAYAIVNFVITNVGKA